MNLPLKIALSIFLIIATIYIMCKFVLWAKKRSNGAYVLAIFMPLIAMQPIPPPTYEAVEEAKNHRRKKSEDDSGDPPNNDEEAHNPNLAITRIRKKRGPVNCAVRRKNS